MSQAPALLAGAATTTFRLNGQFLGLADRLAAPAGLTAASWQVLGAVLGEPASVAGIARTMGLARQSVQRLADILVAEGMVEYQPNPAHRRAKLVVVTARGRAAVAKIGPAQRRAAEALSSTMGHDELVAALASLQSLSAALEKVGADTT